MTRLTSILILLAFTLRCPAPVTLPPVGFDAGNWSAIATALNNEYTNAPSIGNDQGGLHYIGILNTGFACTAVASNQFATAVHVFPTGGPLNMGNVTYGGNVYEVTNRAEWNDFGILTVSGTVSNWTRINTNAPSYPFIGIAWGTGQGFKPGDAVYTNSGNIVFPVQSETAALRWGRRLIEGFASYHYGIVVQSNTNGNAALTGGDSGGPLFLLNESTGRHELVGTHYGATFIDNNPVTASYGYHNSSYAERAGITAYLNHGDPPEPAASSRTMNVGTLVFGR